MDNKHSCTTASPTEPQTATEITKPVLIQPFPCSLEEIHRQVRDIIASASDISDRSTFSGHYGPPGTGRSPSLPEDPNDLLP